MNKLIYNIKIYRHILYLKKKTNNIKKKCKATG